VSDSFSTCQLTEALLQVVVTTFDKLSSSYWQLQVRLAVELLLLVVTMFNYIHQDLTAGWNVALAKLSFSRCQNLIAVFSHFQVCWSSFNIRFEQLVKPSFLLVHLMKWKVIAFTTLIKSHRLTLLWSNISSAKCHLNQVLLQPNVASTKCHKSQMLLQSSVASTKWCINQVSLQQSVTSTKCCLNQVSPHPSVAST
jgi:hypothetical protein